MTTNKRSAANLLLTLSADELLDEEQRRGELGLPSLGAEMRIEFAEVARAGGRTNWETETARLRPLFDLVAPVDDWRGTINRTVPNATLKGVAGSRTIAANTVADAVEFYTGTRPTISYRMSGVRFVGVGYRNGPCGP